MSLIEGEQDCQDSIDEIKRNAYQIEGMGNDINNELYAQGEKMKSIRDNVLGANNDIDESNRLVSTMLARENRNRIIIAIIIIAISIIFFIVLFYKYGGDDASTKSQ